MQVSDINNIPLLITQGKLTRPDAEAAIVDVVSSNPYEFGMAYLRDEIKEAVIEQLTHDVADILRFFSPEEMTFTAFLSEYLYRSVRIQKFLYTTDYSSFPGLDEEDATEYDCSSVRQERVIRRRNIFRHHQGACCSSF